MSNLSVVINTLNEAENLPKVISSIKGLAEEIIVVDMESTDGTPEIAKKLGAKVIKHPRINYVEPARNFGVSKATRKWILILDSDEEIPKDLAEEIKKSIIHSEADYFRLPRKNLIFGKWLKHSRWWPDYNIRLFKKGFVSWNEIIHAVPVTQGIGADFPAKEEFSIVHHHYNSLEQFIERMNRYTSVQAAYMVKEKYQFKWREILTKPTNEFLSRYFFGEGYKDGLHGLALSLLQAFSELVLYLKVWQASKFKETEIASGEVVSVMKDLEKEVHFWQSDTMYKQSGKITDRIRRKLRI